MKMKESKCLALLCSIFSLLLLAGCGVAGKNGGREAAIGQRFKLGKDETVSIRDTDLTVQLKSVRRSWTVDGKGETADADILVTLAGKDDQRKWLGIGERVTAANYVIELSAADPFGETSCELIVGRR